MLQQVKPSNKSAAHVDKNQKFRDVEALMTVTVRDAIECDQSILTFGIALRKFRLSIEATDRELMNCGLAFDPYVLSAKVLGIVDVALHLATDGDVGKCRTLDTPLQLMKNKRGSLKAAATEYSDVKLRAVSDRLGITDQPPEAA